MKIVFLSLSLAALSHASPSKAETSNHATEDRSAVRDDAQADNAKRLYLGKYDVIDRKCRGFYIEKPCRFAMTKVEIRLGTDGNLSIFILAENGELIDQIGMNPIGEHSQESHREWAGTEWATLAISNVKAEHRYQMHTYNWITSPRKDYDYRTTLVRNSDTLTLQRECGYSIGYGNPVADYWNESYELRSTAN